MSLSHEESASTFADEPEMQLDSNDGTELSKQITTESVDSFENILNADPKDFDTAPHRPSDSSQSSAQSQTEVKTDLQRLISDHLKQSLEKQNSWETQTRNHVPYLTFAGHVKEKYAFPTEAFENFMRLLCGCTDFPVIILPIAKRDHLPYDKMIAETPALRWLQDCLQCHGLSLDDVMILDLLPMLSEAWLNESDEDTRDNAIDDAFQLTRQLLQDLKPSIILSCRSVATTCYDDYKRGGVLTDLLIVHPCSSIYTAEKQKVTELQSFPFCHIIHGFHPDAIWDKKDDDRVRVERILADILREVYAPCGDFKRLQRQRTKDGFPDASHKLDDAAHALLLAMSRYRRIQMTARELDVSLGEWQLDTDGDWWPNLIRGLYEIVSTAGCVM